MAMKISPTWYEFLQSSFRPSSIVAFFISNSNDLSDLSFMRLRADQWNMQIWWLRWVALKRGNYATISTRIARESGYFFRLLSPGDIQRDSGKPRAITQRFIVNLRGFRRSRDPSFSRAGPSRNLFRRNYLRKQEDLCDPLPCTVVNFMYGRKQLVRGCKSWRVSTEREREREREIGNLSSNQKILKHVLPLCPK